MRCGVLLATVTGLFVQAGRTPHAQSSPFIAVESSSPLYEIKIMVRAGSADDPAGKEGTAALVASALLEAGFGDPGDPITKERLADLTRPWGSRALPSVLAEKETTTFSMAVPKEAFGEFVDRILRPMFNQPLWRDDEIDRLRREALVQIRSRLRLENQEQLGLLAFDNYVFEGTPLQHLVEGTVEGLEAITREDLDAFYRRHYTRGNMVAGGTISDAADRRRLLEALPPGSAAPMAAAPRAIAVPPVQGRALVIITQPNAIASVIQAGFPIEVTRAHPDYWPLYVANVFLGTHRDSFGRLYTYIREERGYNYGSYSYIEYLVGRPFFLFPPPATPRSRQYFGIWIRPVGHEYVHFIMKGFMYELDRLIREGLTDREVAEARIKTRTLYLNFAESKDRQVGYRLDDRFYGMEDRGYLETMLQRVDSVTTEQVNAAIRTHLQTANVKFLIVTHAKEAERLAADIASGSNVVSRSQAEYNIPDPVPSERRHILERDAAWKRYPLNIPRDRIRIVPVERMFEKASAW
ncbi:MAG TPA: insulinase family protein [Vicinamibacterales bacterium]|nr:insulinase family protein [Vicinamibacterales bacterium]